MSQKMIMRVKSPKTNKLKNKLKIQKINYGKDNNNKGPTIKWLLVEGSAVSILLNFLNSRKKKSNCILIEDWIRKMETFFKRLQEAFQLGLFFYIQ